MQIEDEELRTLYESESADNLARLEQGLLALERNPQDRALLEDLFREAHTMKGAAGMLGVEAVESLAHHFEDVLDAARHGVTALTSEHADRLYRALDAMSKLVGEAVTGEPSGVDLREVLRELRDGPQQAAAPVAPNPALPPSVAVEVPAAELVPASQVTSTSTIRVEIQKLDRMLAEVGDLVVTTARTGLRRAELAQALDLYDEWEGERRRRKRPRGATYQRESSRLREFGKILHSLARSLSDDQTRLQNITDQLQADIQALRMLPLTGVLNLFPRLVRDLARQIGKSVQLGVEGADTTADKRLLQGIKDPLMHLVRNSVDHGIEPPEVRVAAGKSPEARIWIRAWRVVSTLHVEVSDDGGGLKLEAIRRKAFSQGLRSAEELARMSDREVSMLIFEAGLSTAAAVTDVSGRGTGLDAVLSSVLSLGGTLDVSSQPGRGCTFLMRLPVTLATSRLLICQEGERLYGVPLEFIERTLLLGSEGSLKVSVLGGRTCLEAPSGPIPLAPLGMLLGLPDSRSDHTDCFILRYGEQRVAFLTDRLLEVAELVVKPLHESPLVQGAAILPSGRVCVVLQPSEILRRNADQGASLVRKASIRVLVAEDSPTVLAFQKKVLLEAGYSVTTASDGQQAWDLAQKEQFQAVISDIEMPNMTGLALTQRLRSLPNYRDVPVVLLTSLGAAEDRQRGMEVGASAYLVKSAVDGPILLKALERFL